MPQFHVLGQLSVVQTCNLGRIFLAQLGQGQAVNGVPAEDVGSCRRLIKQAIEGWCCDCQRSGIGTKGRHDEAATIADKTFGMHVAAALMDRRAGMKVTRYFAGARSDLSLVMAKDDVAERQFCSGMTTQALWREGIMVAADPMGLNRLRQGDERSLVVLVDFIVGNAIVKAVTKQDEPCCPDIRDQTAQGGQRQGCVKGRHIEAAAGQACAVLQMQVGDNQCFLRRPEQAARQVRHKFRLAEPD